MQIISQLNNNLPQAGRELKNSVTGITIHSIAKTIEGLFAPDWLEKNYDLLQSSAHFFIDIDGKIYQRVPITWRANHAGKSEWDGITGLNFHNIGIEFMANFDSRGSVDYKRFEKFIDREKNWMDGDFVYSSKQLIAGSELIAWLMKEIPTIQTGRIERHSIVSPDSLRGAGEGKHDPGNAFPWETLKKNFSTIA